MFVFICVRLVVYLDCIGCTYIASWIERIHLREVKTTATATCIL